MKKTIVIFILLAALAAPLLANVDENIGNLRVVIENYTGSIGLYKKLDDGSYLSLFDSKTFTKSPSFFVNYNGKAVPLNSSGGFKLTSSYKNEQAIITAEMRNKLKVVIYLDFFASTSNGTIDSVKITSVATNLTEVEQEVAVKAFFDTSLGENTTAHFISSMGREINTEMSFNSLSDEAWIQSGNANAIARFFVPRISNVDSLTMANKNLLIQTPWNYNVQSGREFHSLNSYNNSALAITWQPRVVKKDPVDMLELYILTGEISGYVPTSWPPTQKENTVFIPEIQSPTDGLSRQDLEKIKEILATIELLQADNSYLNEQEILSLSSEVDAILKNAGR